MIKYPDVDIKTKEISLQYLINYGNISVGERVFLENNPVTCVHIEGDKYIFSMDDIFKIGTYDQIEQILKTVYKTGAINNIRILPRRVVENIDFLFVPNKEQVIGEKQFEWFKRGSAVKIKGYQSGGIHSGESYPWWICDHCYIDCYGHVKDHYIYNGSAGIPIFFQMTKK